LGTSFVKTQVVSDETLANFLNKATKEGGEERRKTLHIKVKDKTHPSKVQGK
jgi:hypothetical protein